MKRSVLSLIGLLLLASCAGPSKETTNVPVAVTNAPPVSATTNDPPPPPLRTVSPP